MNILMRIKNSRVASNASWIVGCKLCKALLMFISIMVVSRYLGVAKYGTLSYASGLVSFMMPIMKLGLGEILVHEIVGNPNKEGEILGTTIGLCLLSGLLSVLGIGIFVSIVNADERDTFLVCICYSLQLVFQALEMIYYWFQAKLKSKYTSIAILISYIIVICVQIVFVLCRTGVAFFAFANSLEYILIAVILLVFYRKEHAQKLKFSMQEARRLLNISKYYIISGLMVMIFSQTDKIMLKLVCDETAVGFYSAASTCACTTSFIFAAIIDSYRPSIFDSIKNPALFKKKMISLYSIVIWLSLGQCIVMTIASPIIIRFMYGEGYNGAINVLRVVVWFTTFSYIGTIRNIWILSYGYQKYLGLINFSGAVVNVFLNLVLIPKYGPMGAAVASVAAQFFTNVVIGYIVSPLRAHNRLLLDAINPIYIFKWFQNAKEY